MPTIIDSLFLQLGIDTSKFSADQKKALAKIQQFESQTKKSADKAAQRVKTVGQAFRDIADDSAIGNTSKRLDTMAVKLRTLGQAGRVSGGVSGGLGMMAEGLGALLSPATLAVAAIGLLGKAAWDFNEKMTATNATIYRQSQLSGINASKLWAWGQAAKAVGGTATDIPNFMVGLSTQLAGGFTGFGNPGQMLAGMALMGIPYRPGQNVNPASLIEGYRNYAKARGGGTFGWDAARAMAMQTGLYDPSLFKFAMPGGGGLKAYEYAKHAAPKSFTDTIKKSLMSQRLLGYKDIQEAVLAERTYGGIQNPMQALVGLMTNLLAAVNTMLGWTIKIADWVGAIAEHFGVKPLGELAGHVEKWLLGKSPSAIIGGVKVAGNLPGDFVDRQILAMRVLMGRGMSQKAAAAMVGNASQESGLNPFATNEGHAGLFQLDKARQAAFAKLFHYNIGAKNVPARQQFLDQLLFSVLEFKTTQKEAARKMAAAHGLAAKTRAFEKYDERPGDHSYGRRLLYAQEAEESARGLSPHTRLAREMHAAANMHLNMLHAIEAAKARQRAIQHVTTHHTKIDAVNVATQATDADGMARGARKALSTHPLIGPAAQHQVVLSTHGMAG